MTSIGKIPETQAETQERSGRSRKTSLGLKRKNEPTTTVGYLMAIFTFFGGKKTDDAVISQPLTMHINLDRNMRILRDKKHPDVGHHRNLQDSRTSKPVRQPSDTMVRQMYITPQAWHQPEAAINPSPPA